MKHTKLITALMGSILLQPLVFAEEFSRIQVGANYYQKGVFSETAVQVIAVNVQRRRVQIHNPDTNFVDWVTADTLITPSEATERTLTRGVIGLAILGALLSDDDDKTAQTVKKQTTSSARSAPTSSAPPKLPKLPAPPKLPEPTYSKEQLAERDKDIQRSIPLPLPPDVVDKVFTAEELQFEAAGSKGNFIGHSKEIRYAGISHVDYHPTEHWVVLVENDGTRHDLGGHIAWQARPEWNKSEFVTLVRVENGKPIQGSKFPLNAVQRDERSKNYRIGIHLASKESSEEPGIKVADVVPDSPAAKAGIKAGDILVRVDQKMVSGLEDFTSYIRASGGKTIRVQGFRGTEFISIALDPAESISVPLPK